MHLPRIDHTRVRFTPDEALAAAAGKPTHFAVRLEISRVSPSTA